MAKKYFPRLRLRGGNFETEAREERERIRLNELVNIDRSVFKKSKTEKLLLKVAKAQLKEDELRS